MNTKSAIIEALALVAINNAGGFTVDARTLQPISKGYAVAVKETQDSHDSEGLQRVVSYAGNHPEINAYGGWMDSETGKYYYDAVRIIDDRDEAIRAGRENGQIAIFDLQNLEEIRLF